MTDALSIDDRERPATCAAPLATRFEDLPVVAEFTTPGRTITEADLVNFASLTGDWHPLHTDAVYAAEGPFGERVAHGMCVLSYAVGLMRPDAETVVALRRVADATFKRPAHIGDTMRVRGQLTPGRAVTEQAGMVECRLRVVDQRDDTLLRATIDLLWRRRDPAEGRAA